MPVFPRAKKGEEGRVSTGRFNRSFAMEKMKLLSGGKDVAAKPSDRSRTSNGFKSKFDSNKKPGGFGKKTGGFGKKHGGKPMKGGRGGKGPRRR